MVGKRAIRFEGDKLNLSMTFSHFSLDWVQGEIQIYLNDNDNDNRDGDDDNYSVKQQQQKVALRWLNLNYLKLLLTDSATGSRASKVMCWRWANKEEIVEKSLAFWSSCLFGGWECKEFLFLPLSLSLVLARHSLTTSQQFPLFLVAHRPVSTWSFLVLQCKLSLTPYSLAKLNGAENYVIYHEARVKGSANLSCTCNCDFFRFPARKTQASSVAIIHLVVLWKFCQLKIGIGKENSS